MSTSAPRACSGTGVRVAVTTTVSEQAEPTLSVYRLPVAATSVVSLGANPGGQHLHAIRPLVNSAEILQPSGEVVWTAQRESSTRHRKTHLRARNGRGLRIDNFDFEIGSRSAASREYNRDETTERTACTPPLSRERG